MSRSSIFSFETLHIGDVRRSGAWQAAALTLILVGSSEAVARHAVAPIGRYWEYWSSEAAAKFETYRADTAHGRAPAVVIVGDSSAARNIDPTAFEPDHGGAFSLAWPANFPKAFARTTLPLLQEGQSPKLVVVSFSPTAFLESPTVRRFEQSILSSPYARRAAGEWRAGDVTFLARLRPALPFFSSWWSGTGLPGVRHKGFMPLDGTNFGRDPIEPWLPFEDSRFAVLETLRDIGRRRGFAVIVVVPPRLEPSETRQRAETIYLEKLTAGGFEIRDFREHPALTRGHFHDRGHLNREGARVMSEQLSEAAQEQ